MDRGVLPIIAALIFLKWAVQLWLDRLNQRNVLAHAAGVPDAFKGVVDEATYAKSVQYTLAKGRLDQVETTYDTAVLLLVLFTGLLPWAFRAFVGRFGASAGASAAFLMVVGIALSLPGLPLAWYAQFRLEERFGFNTTTQ